MAIQVIGVVAEFERDFLVERTQSGLARARRDGKVLGRLAVRSDADPATIMRADRA
jgi:putative DNA-invertase from lambdoid prophage Rac